MRDALAPVAEALLRQARLDADAVTCAAEHDAAQTIEDARRQAREIIAAAREQGEAEAKAYSAAVRARNARQARSMELAARRDALEELRRRAGAAVQALRDDPCYPRLVKRLGELAREAGGDDLVVREHPDGGVVAEGRGRRVDCSLEALANRAVDALGAEAERLWAP
ncbi:V-type ATP synthase subunit E family protein [Microbispora triticiradicis]|uniref:V-type ATP synthase subunit E family protein n=1 Tax=Microbispora triticiradicis TaxID=2200763 RepID=UPI001FCADE07|nr:V-type ATP synthase subunit E family protein [Microbispora triticiradicis]